MGNYHFTLVVPEKRKSVVPLELETKLDLNGIEIVYSSSLEVKENEPDCIVIDNTKRDSKRLIRMTENGMELALAIINLITTIVNNDERIEIGES